MISWLQFLLWFCFELPQAGHKPNPTPFNEGHIWEVLAFGNVAAIGFVCFVLLDLIQNYIRRHGPSRATENLNPTPIDFRFWVAVVLGVLAAFIVAVLATVFNILQLNVQSALITGLTWQVVYVRLITLMNGTAASIRTTPLPQPDNQIGRDEEEGP